MRPFVGHLVALCALALTSAACRRQVEPGSTLAPVGKQGSREAQVEAPNTDLASSDAVKEVPKTQQPARVTDSPEWSNSFGMKFRNVAPGEFLLVLPQRDAVVSVRDAWMRQQEGRSIPRAVRKSVRITKPYAISVCEVKLSEFMKVMGRAPAAKTDDYRIAGDSERPAVSVSWEEAREFCRQLSELPEEKKAGRRYRLPTEAEWQYARENGRCVPCFSWNRRPIHWTVWEWCSNWFDESYYETMPRDDPQGPPKGSGHVVRLAWTHRDPFVEVYTFRVVAEGLTAR